VHKGIAGIYYFIVNIQKTNIQFKKHQKYDDIKYLPILCTDVLL